MATGILKDQRVFVAGKEVSQYTRAVSLSAAAEALDSTALNQDARAATAGLLSSEFSLSLLFDDQAAMDSLVNSVHGSAVLISVGVVAGADGEPVYFSRMVPLSSTPVQGAAGDLVQIDLGAQGADSLYRGTIMAPLASRGSDGSGVVRQLGAASSKVVLAAHVVSVSGTTPSLTIDAESDDNPGFTTPTARASLSGITAAGGYLTSAAGAVTDTYWRVSWTIGGASPSFTFIVYLALK